MLRILESGDSVFRSLRSSDSMLHKFSTLYKETLTENGFAGNSFAVIKLLNGIDAPTPIGHIVSHRCDNGISILNNVNELKGIIYRGLTVALFNAIRSAQLSFVNDVVDRMYRVKWFSGDATTYEFTCMALELATIVENKGHISVIAWANTEIFANDDSSTTYDLRRRQHDMLCKAIRNIPPEFANHPSNKHAIVQMLTDSVLS